MAIFHRGKKVSAAVVQKAFLLSTQAFSLALSLSTFIDSLINEFYCRRGRDKHAALLAAGKASLMCKNIYNNIYNVLFLFRPRSPTAFHTQFPHIFLPGSLILLNNFLFAPIRSV